MEPPPKPSGRVALVVASLIVVALVALFRAAYAAPSPTFVLAIQTVSGTRPPTATLADYAVPSPAALAERSALLGHLVNTSDPVMWGGGEEQERKGKEERKVEMWRDEKGRWVPLHSRRFNAKLHMLCMVEMLYDYTLSYMLVYHQPLRLIDREAVTPNMISVLSLFLGMCAGGCFIASVKGKLSFRGCLDAVNRVRSVEEGNPVVEEEEKSGQVQYGSVNTFIAKLGCIFFFARNLMDALDGSLARARRQRAHEAAKPISYSGGHAVDSICDTVGGACCLIGLGIHLFQRDVLISPTVMTILHNVFGRCATRLPMRRISNAFIVAGCALPAVSALGWQEFMIKYANTFDVHPSAALFTVESTFAVRFNQFLWGLICGDAFFLYFNSAMLLGKLWPVMQVLVILCYPYFALLAVWSVWLWASVISKNPAVIAVKEKLGTS